MDPLANNLFSMLALADAHAINLTLSVALAAGVLAQVVAKHLRIPALILLLALGGLLGPEGIGWVNPAVLGDWLYLIVEFGIAIILFEGGINLQSSRLRRQEKPIRLLITVGAMVTLVGAALAARYILDWSWMLSFMFGSMVVVTGPTVVTPLVRNLRLHPRMKTILEAEGVLIDPVGAVLAALMVEIALAGATAESLRAEFIRLGMSLGLGSAAGILGGLLLGAALRFRHLVPHGLTNIFALVFVLLLFSVCQHFFSASGILAVTVAGVVMGFMKTPVDRELREFKDQLTLLLVGLLFILLTAAMKLSDFENIRERGYLVVLALILVIRPLCVFISTRSSNLSTNEKLFISWIAPRGIVAASITSLAAVQLDAAGLPGGPELRGLVFLTIAITVVLAGLTSLPVASLLRVRLPSRNRVAILGADGLGLTLARLLKESGTPVVFLDSDPTRCKLAENEGFNVVFGDALEERTMLRAQFELVGTAIGLTANDHLNSLYIRHAKEWFGVPRGLVALGVLTGGVPQLMEKQSAEILFEGPHDVERWDVRVRHGQSRLLEMEYRPEEAEIPTATPDKEVSSGGKRLAERYAILAVRRAKKVSPMSSGFKLKSGDVGHIVIYTTEETEAMARLKAAGWREITADAPAETEVKPEEAPKKDPDAS